MARGRSLQYEDQRDEIVDRAAALFARQGYANTSMNELAAACGVSKPALYHYWRDKQHLLAHICRDHVDRLETLIADAGELPVDADAASAERHLRGLIGRFVEAYADARDRHRVLTEDEKFLDPQAREEVLAAQRRVVGAFATAIAAVRPDVPAAQLDKPLAMLLFGMINWMFTWLRPDGALSHAEMAPIVADLFFGGLPGVRLPPPAR